ncbi:hypothetical protein VP01_1309g5 [Puccinia sorghi]|uniref:Uncharacterized protein n=1 Tax=Puccinia sorghi TaxID=27349 RepID=A0A0L6VN04_9BASI|nr:hypothetical protein VP01_1309g5 [Puccinia sorghi]
MVVIAGDDSHEESEGLRSMILTAHTFLHPLQVDNLLAQSKYENMKAYDTLLTPAKLKAFEEGVLTKEQNLVVSSWQDAYWTICPAKLEGRRSVYFNNAFIDSIFDFKLFEKLHPQADNDIIKIDDDEGERNLTIMRNSKD